MGVRGRRKVSRQAGIEAQEGRDRRKDVKGGHYTINLKVPTLLLEHRRDEEEEEEKLCILIYEIGY